MFVASIVSVCAQSECGRLTIAPKVGVNSSVFAYNGEWSFNPDWKMGLVLGAEAEYGLSRSFAVTAGLDYSQSGTCERFRMDDVYREWNVHARCNKVTSHNLSLPIAFKYYVYRGLALKAGVRFNYLMSTSVSGVAEAKRVLEKPGMGIWDNHEDLFYDDGTPVQWETFGSSHANDWVEASQSRVTVDIPLGASFEYKNFVLAATCYLRVSDNKFTQSLMDNYNSDGNILNTFDYQVRNESFDVSVAYRFHLGGKK